MASNDRQAPGTPLAALSSLRSVPEASKREALLLLQTAYALLLANHGQLTSLRARQAIDAMSLGFELNGLPSFDREFSGQCGGRFAEAQVYVRHALEALGATAPEPREGLKVMSRSESVFDGLFDLLALEAASSNLQQNRRFSGEVCAVYEAVRRSSPELSRLTKPLTDLDQDTGESGESSLIRFFEYLSPVLGSPRFWPRSKFIAAGALAVLVVGLFVTSIVSAILKR
jgi:hypothetical protein